QQLPHEGESITVAKWPEVEPSYNNEEAVMQMDRLVSIIRSVRNIRAEVDTPMSREIRLFIRAESEEIVEELVGNKTYLTRFCNPSELVIDTTADPQEESMTAVVTGAEIFLPLEGLIDFEKEIARLEKELEKWNSEVERVVNKLGNEGFVSKAPEKLVEAERQKEKEYMH